MRGVASSEDSSDDELVSSVKSDKNSYTYRERERERGREREEEVRHEGNP